MTDELPLPHDADIPDALLAQMATQRQLKIIRLLGWVPQVYDAWIGFVTGLYEIEMDAILREVVICRYGKVTRCEYELFQHSQVARSVGLTESQLLDVLTADRVADQGPSVEIACRLVDEFETNAGHLSDEVRDRAIATFGTQGFVQLLVLMGHYSCVTRVLNATRLKPELSAQLGDATSPVR